MSDDDENQEKDPLVTISGVEMRASRKKAIYDAVAKHIRLYTSRTLHNYIIYFVFIIVIGLPLWWITTSPYRASLQKISPGSINFPVDIQFFALPEDSQLGESLVRQFMNEDIFQLPNDDYGAAAIKIQPNLSFRKVKEAEIVRFVSMRHSSRHVNLSVCKIIVVPDALFSKLSSKSACPSFVTASGVFLVRSSNTDSDNRHYIEEYIRNQWMDVPKIVNFMNRASRGDTEHSSSDVWNEVPISGAYNIHLLFIHDNVDDNGWAVGVEDETRKEIEKIVGYLSDTAHFKVTEEHFWDLFDTAILKKTVGNDSELASYTGKSSDYLNLMTEIDQRVSPFVSPHPLLKFVFLLTRNGVLLDGQKVKGQTYLSWGTLINATPDNKKEQQDALHESFQTLFGAAEGSSSDVKFCFERSLPSQFIWDRFRRRAFFENAIRSKIFINAVNSLASAIPNLVITEEVGAMVKKSNELFVEAVKEQSTQKIAATRLLAEKAAKHESLLGISDLAMYFKFGLYVPIFMPLVHPVLEVVYVYVFYKLKDVFLPYLMKRCRGL